jgi:uncharacterized protein DUF3592
MTDPQSRPAPPDPWRENTLAAQRRILAGSLTGTALFVWALPVAHYFFGFNFIPPPRGAAPDPGGDTLMYVGVAAAVTVLTALAFAFLLRRNAGLLRDGVMLPATVARVQTFGGQSLVRVHYVYEVGGRQYKKGAPMDRAAAERFQHEGGLMVLVDPKRPGRAMLRA